MSTTRKVVSASLALALGIGGMAALTACSPQQLVQNAVENAVEDATGGDVNVDIGADGSVSMPADFPADVPVISGDLVTAGSFGNAGAMTWEVVVKVGDVQSSYNEAKSKLEGAGYASTMDMSSDGSFSGLFGNDKYSIILIGEDGADGKVVAYTVSNMAQ